jgi:hypothetical protein
MLSGHYWGIKPAICGRSFKIDVPLASASDLDDRIVRCEGNSSSRIEAGHIVVEICESYDG